MRKLRCVSRFFIIPLLGLGACSGRSNGTNDFVQCWKFVERGNGTYLLNFRALIYPRNGVLAFNQDCPNLRLNLDFYDTGAALSDGLFDKAELSGERVGIAGKALITIEGRKGDSALAVKVQQLLEVRELNNLETKRLKMAMEEPIQ